MKNHRFIIVFAILFALVSSNIESKDFLDKTDRAKRDLKLGNTYRESGDFLKSLQFLQRGKEYFESNDSWEFRYWRAVAYEYLGYYYRDQAFMERSAEKLNFAKSYFMKALSIYNEIISMDDGSQNALPDVIKNLGKVNATIASLQNLDINTVTPGQKPDESVIYNFDNGKHKTLPAAIPDEAINISLANNKFKTFPGGLLRLEDLEYLDLSHNRIKTIPVNIDDLKKLKYLSLEDNRLKSIPASFCKMTELKVLNLRNNKIPFPEIVNLIRCLPNTNILFDEYERKEDEDFEDFQF